MGNFSVKHFFLVFLLVIQSCSFNKFFYNTGTDKKVKSEASLTFQELSLINRSGDTLNGLVLNPVSELALKGNVLLIHGNSGDVNRWTDNAKYLYRNGYRVLVFDYQGYGKSTGKPTHKNVVTDTELFLDYMFAEYGRVILWGLSLGGNLAVNVAYRNTEKVKALIVEGGFTSHNEIARTRAPKIFKPAVLFSVRSPYKSKKIIAELHIPVLITHSPTDKVVPYEMGRILFENANEPKYFLELKGDHCLGIQNNLSEYLKMIDKINAE